MLARILVVFFLSLSIASPAYAKWHMAESDNFVIYADAPEEDLADFADMLERYHSAIGIVTGQQIAKPSPSNRLTIYVAGKRSTLRKLHGGKNRFVAGFYVPRAGGSVAFVETLKIPKGKVPPATIALLHEYAHHYLANVSRVPLPLWLREGAAEYLAAARFGQSGAVQMGAFASHRFDEIYFADDVTVRELVDPDRGGNSKGKYDDFYGKSWLLYYYLTSEPDRVGQIDAYKAAIAAGTDPVTAAQEIFGDLAVLERALINRYRNWEDRSFIISADDLSITPSAVTPLSKGAAAMLPVVMMSKRGLQGEEARELAAEARDIASAHSADPFVMAALAEAEYQAGNDLAAIAAADAAIALDPSTKNALLQKGYALFRVASGAEDQDSAYAAAMEPFAALNALENDHPLPLIRFYLSYVDRGLAPSDQAKHALERAAQLAPFDKALWLSVGIMQAREGQFALARSSILPIANDPHGGTYAETASALLARLDAANQVEQTKAAQ